MDHAELDARDLLREHGEQVARVVRVDTPGDSAAAFTEILFITAEQKAKRAYVFLTRAPRKVIVWCYEGWDLPSGWEEAPE